MRILAIKFSSQYAMNIQIQVNKILICIVYIALFMMHCLCALLVHEVH